MRLDAGLRQHGALAFAHLALIVRFGVIVAEEVEDAVCQQVSHLGVEVVTGLRRLSLGRLERDVLSLDPQVVIVALGGNDLLRKVPETQT